MSGYHYKPSASSTPREEFNFSPPLAPQPTQPHGYYPDFTSPMIEPLLQPQFSTEPVDLSQLPLPDDTFYDRPTQPSSWVPPPLPATTYPYPQHPGDHYVGYPTAFNFNQTSVAGPSTLPMSFSSPKEIASQRITRAASLVSEASSSQSYAVSEVSRGASPSANEMSKFGTRNSNGSWSCAYPGCSSRSTFNRGCDLRKHYKRHSKTLFCRHDGCPQSIEGGFSSKKDRSRHEAKHNPGILCEWDGCERLFSRQDNMKDHVRRVHKRRAT